MTSVPRPEFAVTLGLLPPYTIDDVKRAYLDKVKDAHPDHGGSPDAFNKIQQAFEEANHYLRFRSDRRLWIAARMEEYMAVESLVERMRALGATVDTMTLDWVQKSFGDFANLTESVTSIELTNSPKVVELIDLMVAEQTILPGLKQLTLSGCPLTNVMVIQLRVFRGLHFLDVSNTPITDRALQVVEWLPELRDLKIDGTQIGWWARSKAERALKKRRRAQPDPNIFHPANIR